MQKNHYKFKEIIYDENLIFNLKLDWCFKNIFMNANSFSYLCLVLSKILNIDLELLRKNLRIINNELPSQLINARSSYADLVCIYKKINIIIEMNYVDRILHLYKNHSYIMKQHVCGLNKKNKYGRYKKTILINLDYYDSVGENELIYVEDFRIKKYNKCIYNNIKIFYINLAYLEHKYYNEEELNELEKILLIFIEQREDMIRKYINREEIENVFELMERLNFQEGYPVTYDRDEFEKIIKERFEKDKKRFAKTKKDFERDKKELIKNKKELMQDKKELMQDKKEFTKEKEILENDMQTLEVQKQNLETEKTNLENEKTNLKNEKIILIKELKEINIPIDKIAKLTNMSKNQILNIN